MSAKKAQGVTAEIKDGRLDLKGKMPTSSVRNFESRGIDERDGGGPCKVLGRGAIRMPNGDLAQKDDTFDPRIEKMSPNRFRFLVDGKYVEAEKDFSDKLLKHWETKNAEPKGKPKNAERDPDEGKDGSKADAGGGK